MTIQLVFLYLSADPASGLPPLTARHMLIAANVLGIVVAQIKKNNPPPPPPRKGRKVHYGRSNSNRR